MAASREAALLSGSATATFGQAAPTRRKPWGALGMAQARTLRRGDGVRRCRWRKAFSRAMPAWLRNTSRPSRRRIGAPVSGVVAEEEGDGLAVGHEGQERRFARGVVPERVGEQRLEAARGEGA